MKKRIVIFILVFGLAYGFYTVCSGDKPDSNAYTGFVESDITKAMTTVGGRITAVHAHEGDKVVKGQLLAELDQTELIFSRDKLVAAIAMKQNKLDSLLEGADDKDIQNIKLQLDSVRLKIKLSEENLNRKKSQLEDTRALVESNAMESDQLDAMTLAYQQAETDLSVLKTEYQRLQVSYEDLIEGVDDHTIEIAREDLKISETELANLDWKLDETKVLAPSDGIVRNIYFEEGELLGTGVRLLDIIKADSLYVQFYVDEANFSKVHIGSPIVITLDGTGEKLSAEVTEISDYAQFTPKNISTKEDRQSLVFMVKSKLGDNSKIHSGMMVDVEVDEEGMK